VALRPAVGDHGVDDGRRQRHVQAAVARRVQVGELAVDHEAGPRGVTAAGQVERPRARDRHVAVAHDDARQLAGAREHLLLQRDGRGLIELRVRVRRCRARARAGPLRAQVRLHARAPR
jgi:hypothetical protein